MKVKRNSPLQPGMVLVAPVSRQRLCIESVNGDGKSRTVTARVIGSRWPGPYTLKWPTQNTAAYPNDLDGWEVEE